MQLSEKYRPKTKSDWIGSMRAVNQVFHHVDLMLKGKPVFKIILLEGPRGVGKTSIPQMAANHFNLNVVEMNASDERKKADIIHIWRTMITQTIDGIGNLILIDEVDGMTKAMQEKLVKASETIKTPCILCANYGHKISYELRKIALVIKIDHPQKDDISDLLNLVVEKEGIILPRSLINQISSMATDYRSALNYLELAIASGDVENLTVDKETGSMIDQITATLKGHPPDRWGVGSDPYQLIKWMSENSNDLDIVSHADRFVKIQKETEDYHWWKYAFALLMQCRNDQLVSLNYPVRLGGSTKYNKKGKKSGSRPKKEVRKESSSSVSRCKELQPMSSGQSLKKWI